MAVNKPKPSDGKVDGPQEKRRGQTVRGRAAGTGRTVNQQFSLFPPEAIGPPSLRYYPKIITPSMELDLIERIRGLACCRFNSARLRASGASHRSASNTTTGSSGFRRQRRCRHGWRR